jgi:sec-independent protein translocase protein TatC
MTLPADEGNGATCVKPFIEHLEDLRRTILWCAGFLLAGLTIAVPLAPRVLAVLKQPLKAAGKEPDTFLNVIDVMGGLSVAMNIIVGMGFLLSAPFMVVCIARFVFPGLKRRERQAVVQSLAIAVFLFAAGVFVAYRMILPVSLQWLFSVGPWLGVNVEFVRVTDYVRFVMKLLAVFGLTFEFPAVILVLGRLGLVTSRFLAGKRPHVVVILLVVAAVVTPTVDPVTQVLLAAPLYVLYELCIWAVWFMERRQKPDDR